MRAAVWDGPGKMRVAEVEDPVCPADGVLLRVTACGICGSARMTAGRNGCATFAVKPMPRSITACPFMAFAFTPFSIIPAGLMIAIVTMACGIIRMNMVNERFSRRLPPNCGAGANFLSDARLPSCGKAPLARWKRSVADSPR